MSNETDLDWLARNVHAWPVDAKFAVRPGMGEVLFYEHHYPHLVQFSRDQWLARRAELQNKPGWGAVPGRANWLAQDAAGSWLWHSSEPECRNGGWIGSTTRGYAAKGCVLGDWRDTLEKRPEDFKPFTSIEDNQGQDMTQQHDMKQDNGWFERGELPPVGVECEAKKYGKEEWYKVVICGAGKHLGLAVAFYEKQKGSGAFTCSSAEYFRPVRTERDVLLSIIVEEMNRYDTDGKLADAILAAGFSLRDK